MVLGVLEASLAMTQKLTERQRVFVREYLKDLNATRAAKAAGYSDATATAQASRLLANVNIKRAVDAAKAKRAERSDITAERVVAELGHIAFSDITEIVTGGDGATLYVRDLATLPEHVRRCIAEVSEVQTAEGGGTLKVKLHSKVQALRMLMDHLGMDAPKKVENTGANGGPIEVTSVPASEDEVLAMLKAEAGKNPRLREELKKLGGG